MSTSYFPVLDPQISQNLPRGSCQGQDVLGQGGAAVNQQPLTIGSDRHRETRRPGSSLEKRVYTCG